MHTKFYININCFKEETKNIFLDHFFRFGEIQNVHVARNANEAKDRSEIFLALDDPSLTCPNIFTWPVSNIK